MNVLRKTKMYSVGSMQYSCGRGWRDSLKEEFKPLGIHVLDPYNKEFVKNISEDETARLNVQQLREEGNFDELNRFWKDVRVHDLACVDKSDFLVWYLDVEVPTFGSVEEFAWAVRLKRPAYVVIKQGKKKCPDWLFGMVPHHYIFDSLEDFVKEIKDIDNGDKELDNRWRLFSPEIR